MKLSIIAILTLNLASSSAFALNNGDQVLVNNTAYPKTVVLEDISRNTIPHSLDSLNDMQDLHNLDSIYQNNVDSGTTYPYPYPYYFQNRNMYSNPIEKRAVVIPGPSADKIHDERDIEHNVYIHTERPR